jgi:hypothetical protein
MWDGDVMCTATTTVSPYTGHGHLVSGLSDKGWDKPDAVARCGGVGICPSCSTDAARIKMATRESPEPGQPHSIDSDPEFYSGLTMWGTAVSAQVSDTTVVLHPTNSLLDVEMPHTDARRLRDLLNVATARGYL